MKRLHAPTIRAALALALTLGLCAGIAMPTASAQTASDSEVVERYLTPTPVPSPSIYEPVYPQPKPSPQAAAGPSLVQLPVLPTKEAPSLDGRLAGIDISHWNHAIDWNKVAADGISFAIAKATEGGTFRDDRYLANRAGAKAAGLAFTAYEYARPSRRVNDAVRDADHFLEVAQLTDDDLVPVLDLEETGGLGKARLRRWVDAWSDRVYDELGVRPMIYVSSSFWKHPMRNTTDHAALGHPLWIAHWHVTNPWVPGQMWNDRDWTIWQWTSDGAVNGIRGRVDLNVYNGTDLTPLTIGAARSNQQVTEPLPVPEPEKPEASERSRHRAGDRVKESDEGLAFPILELLEDLLF